MTQLAHQIYMQPGNLANLDRYMAPRSIYKSQAISENLHLMIDQYVCLAIDSHRTEMATLLVEGKLKSPPIYVVADEPFKLIIRPFGSNKHVVHGFLFNPTLLEILHRDDVTDLAMERVEFVLPSQRIFEAIESYHTTLKEPSNDNEFPT